MFSIKNGMERRTVLRLLGGAVGSALLWGCGGGGGTPKRMVRGIVLEDDGNGNVTPAGAGKIIAALFEDSGPSTVLEAKSTTDSQGKFTMALTVGREYGLSSSSYHAPSTVLMNNQIDFYGTCTSNASFYVAKGNAPLNVVSSGSDTQSALSDSVARSANTLLSQYQASGIYGELDVLLLAYLPCVTSGKTS